jgi:hypothetical protein
VHCGVGFFITPSYEGASKWSFYRYVAMNEPEHALHCQRILAMPSKRYVRRTGDFIDRTEMEALFAAPDLSTWVGRRDRAILLLARKRACASRS